MAKQKRKRRIQSNSQVSAFEVVKQYILHRMKEVGMQQDIVQMVKSAQNMLQLDHCMMSLENGLYAFMEKCKSQECVDSSMYAIKAIVSYRSLIRDDVLDELRKLA